MGASGETTGMNMIGVAATIRRKYAYQHQEREGKLSAGADIVATSYKSNGIAEDKIKGSVFPSASSDNSNSWLY